jgi:manganese transport system ATP-binding protein
MTCLELQNITVAYHGRLALNGANLRVEPGTIAGIVGMNGAGKSTLFKAIMGLVKLQTGWVSYRGRPVSQQRNLVAYIPQTETVDWQFPVTVYDVVMMGRYGYMNWLRRPQASDRAIVQTSLERTQMLAYQNRQIGELSGGQKKRTFLARTLAQQGDLILLDEPFTGVDVQTERSIIELLLELRQSGKTILVSTHDLASINTFCDQVVLVNRTILAYGPTAEIFTPENLNLAFTQDRN